MTESLSSSTILALPVAGLQIALLCGLALLLPTVAGLLGARRSGRVPVPLLDPLRELTRLLGKSTNASQATPEQRSGQTSAGCLFVALGLTMVAMTMLPPIGPRLGFSADPLVFVAMLAAARGLRQASFQFVAPTDPWQHDRAQLEARHLVSAFPAGLLACMALAMLAGDAAMTRIGTALHGAWQAPLTATPLAAATTALAMIALSIWALTAATGLDMRERATVVSGAAALSEGRRPASWRALLHLTDTAGLTAACALIATLIISGISAPPEGPQDGGVAGALGGLAFMAVAVILVSALILILAHASRGWLKTNNGVGSPNIVTRALSPASLALAFAVGALITSCFSETG